MMTARILAVAAASAVLTGCAAQAAAPQRETIVYVGPKDPRYAIPPQLKEPLRRDNERRMLEAARFQVEAEPVLRAVEADPGFGGFIFRHWPEPHAIVMFTGNAEARLRRYTRDPRFRAIQVELTLAELERMKDAMSPQLVRLGIRCFTVDGDEEHNSVTVGAPPETLEQIRAAIASGRLKAPRKLRLITRGCAELRSRRS